MKNLEEKLLHLTWEDECGDKECGFAHYGPHYHPNNDFGYVFTSSYVTGFQAGARWQRKV